MTNRVGDGTRDAFVPTRVPWSVRSASGSLEADGDIGEDVVDVLDTDGEADESGSDAGRELFLGGELGVRGGRRG